MPSLHALRPSLSQSLLSVTQSVCSFFASLLEYRTVRLVCHFWIKYRDVFVCAAVSKVSRALLSRTSNQRWALALAAAPIYGLIADSLACSLCPCPVVFSEIRGPRVTPS